MDKYMCVIYKILLLQIIVDFTNSLLRVTWMKYLDMCNGVDILYHHNILKG